MQRLFTNVKINKINKIVHDGEDHSMRTFAIPLCSFHQR
ncbi:hypothetical protein B4168_3783 [Anoxybacillus flavithermus]|nr:hypothetical protein B4168_3783 [Anoxybacillus flavithermus]OAO88033.1 hypothetical protein GT23_0766 [Parageobacillus thermoglucosidasius]